MLAFNEMLRHIREGFPSRWNQVLTVALLFVLDFSSFIGLIWWFLLRRDYPLVPEALTVLASIYLACTVILGILAFFFGKLSSVRTAVLFYLSVGLFFHLSGTLGESGKVFSPWPWIILWIFILAVTLTTFSREYYGKEKPPEE